MRIPIATVIVACLLSALPAAAAQARVPQGFAGTMLDRENEVAGVDLDRETGTMARSGVESMRFAIQWIDQQPYPSFDAVPPEQRSRFTDVGGVPTDFSRSDRIVAAGANRRLALLPVVTAAPEWAAKYPGRRGSPPAGTANYAAFVAALVDRYGPRGSFWRDNPSVPRRPIRRWQVWNEPNLPAFWSDERFAPGYVALLRDARRAIKRRDRRAGIVLAGLSNRSWVDLRKIYRQPGVRRLFDTVAVHPYTARPSNVIRTLELVRRTMRAGRDRRKPVVLTELGWPSSEGKAKGFGFETTERNQARRLRKVLPLLSRARKRLRLRGFFYYTWISRENPSEPFNYAGLRRLTSSGRSVPKPVFRTYRRGALRLEGCARKSSIATRCLRRAQR